MDRRWANTVNAIAIGNRAHTHEANTVAIGYSTDATGARTVAIGTTDVQGSNTSHLGAFAAGEGSIALGSQAMTATQIETSDHGKNTGRDTAVNNAIAAGRHSWTRAAGGIAIGGGSTSEKGAQVEKGADAGVALGGEADIGGTVGLVDGARVKVAGGVAVGAGSVANRAAGQDWKGNTRSGYDMLTGGDSNLSTPTWRSTMAAYSVGYTDEVTGDVIITRQVTGVAAGSQPTDLVNVAQLKRAQEALDNHHFNIAANGKGAGVYGNDTVFFVGDDNIMVDLNGQTISIRLNPDLTVDSITIDNDGPVMNADGIDMADTPITNLADGSDPHDAVNKGQLDGVDDRIRAGIAGAVAQANIPQVMTPGKFMVGMGAGHFRDQTSLGVGWSARSDNGRWVMRNSVGLHEDAMSVGGGIGYEF